jgi:hypothetical protein
MDIRREASTPFSVGRPMSSRIKSGFNSSAFRTASNPSDASPMTRYSGLSPEWFVIIDHENADLLRRILRHSGCFG